MKRITDILQGDKWRAAYMPPAPEQSRSVPRPARLEDLQITHPVLATAVAAARRWQRRKADRPEASLVLVGPYGTGKTHIARAILWSVCYTDMDGAPVCPVGRFYPAADLMLRMQPTQTDYGVVEIPQASTIVGGAPIVVIDDAGAEQNLPFVKGDDQAAEIQARYFRVIDYCYTRGVAVVMTSNLTIPALAARLGGRSWDRLNEMAPKGFMVDMTGVPSWREAQSGRGR